MLLVYTCMYAYGTICFWATMTRLVSEMLQELTYLYEYTVCLELLLKLIKIGLLLSYPYCSLTQMPPKLQWFEKVNEVLVVMPRRACTEGIW